MCSQTRGTVAILHLGERLGLWNEAEHPDETQLHMTLLKAFPAGNLLAYGKDFAQDDRDVLWPLRSMFQDHGVPEHRTEERARAALDRLAARSYVKHWDREIPGKHSKH